MQQEIERAAALLKNAQAVVIAASNGFDISDGYNQFASDEEFLRVFGDFNRALGLQCILQGLAAQWPTDEARWAFLARLIDYGYGSYRPSPVMRAVDRLTAGLPRFVVTCNCNSRFQRAGFDPAAVFETEGTYARLRCSATCTDEDRDALPYVERILAGSPGITVSPSAVPRCPHCGAALDIAADDTGRLAGTQRFCEQRTRFERFLQEHGSERIMVLELGMGQRNGAIKQPLMAFAEAAPHAAYAVVNREPAVLPRGMGDRAVGITGDLAPALEGIEHALSTQRPA